MTAEKMARINELARKAKAGALSAEELSERDALRREYIDEFKRGLTQTLDNVYIVDENGEKTKLQKAKRKGDS